jgi:malonyl-CoA O-methyltransferase
MRAFQIDVASHCRAAVDWIRRSTIAGEGIAVSSHRPISYPEVSGYCIPTLLTWGERLLARQYARWLISIQDREGWWPDPTTGYPYTFDTAQVLKGLWAIRPDMPEVDGALERGCRWLLDRVDEAGRLTTPDRSQWGLPGGGVAPDTIHLYALEPLQRAEMAFDDDRYARAVTKALDFYLGAEDLLGLGTLSHFHAYVVEALVDLGRPRLAARGMESVEPTIREDGSIPGYPDVAWTCTPGMAQYAVVYRKLGRTGSAQGVLRALCGLQNPSGGFFGSYGPGADYFPDEEVGWAAKFFLDAAADWSR